MATTLDELLVGLGFDYDPDDLEQFNKDMDSAISTVKSFAKVVIGGTAALVGFAAVTTSVTDKQGKLSKQIGVSVEEIDALEFALKRSGGEGSALGNSLEQLSIRLSEAARGVGSGIEAFGILGISTTDVNGKLKTTDQVLLEVSDSLQRFSKAEQIELADKLGLKDSILLLQEGSDGIKALTDEAKALGVTTGEDAALSAEFQDSLTDIFQITKQLSRLITRSLVPILESTANNMTDWWKANKDVIEQNLPKFIDKATLAIKLLTLASLAFIGVKLVNVLIAMIALFKTLSLSVLATNFAIAALPILIGTIVTALALLAEDAKVFFEGGESFIGKMIEKYPQWAEEIRTVAAVFATVAELTGMIFDGWSEIFKFFSSGTVFEDFALVMKQIGRDISATFEEIKQSIFVFFDDLWKDIVSSFSDNFIVPIMDKVNKLIETVSNISFNPFSDDETSEIKQTVTQVSQVILNADDVPVFNDIKILAEELPNIDDIMLSITDVSELPNMDDIGVDNLLTLQGLSSDQAGFTDGSVESISKDNSSINNKSQVSVGDIKVSVTGITDNPVETGKVVAREIQTQLEPLLRQASQDLNSAVEL